MSMTIHRAYEKLIQPHLTTGKQSTFNTLREAMALISALTYEERGLPRFSWSYDFTVLSIDGRAFPLQRFIALIHGCLHSIDIHLKALFGTCPYGDVLEYIDGRLDPSQPDKWFRDRPQDQTYGTSIFTHEENGFEAYRHRLLQHMTQDPHYFVTANGQTLPKTG
jgi:hypothetical protein